MDCISVIVSTVLSFFFIFSKSQISTGSFEFKLFEINIKNENKKKTFYLITLKFSLGMIFSIFLLGAGKFI